MPRTRTVRRTLTASAGAFALTVGMMAAAGPAHADRCEPEELVLGPNTSPIDERDNPACAVLLQYVYPFVCTNFTTLISCTQTIALNPGYRPQLIPQYNPNFGRAICNLVRFASPGTACTFVGDSATGDITVSTDAGSLVLPTVPLDGPLSLGGEA